MYGVGPNCDARPVNRTCGELSLHNWRYLHQRALLVLNDASHRQKARLDPRIVQGVAVPNAWHDIISLRTHATEVSTASAMLPSATLPFPCSTRSWRSSNKDKSTVTKRPCIHASVDFVVGQQQPSPPDDRLFGWLSAITLSATISAVVTRWTYLGCITGTLA